ncbi:MAG: GC-type dockerin domain-anchored protein [Planctomycetota bacterium]
MGAAALLAMAGTALGQTVLFDSSSATSGRLVAQNAAAAAGITVDTEILDDFIALDAAAADAGNNFFIINNSCCFFGAGYAASIDARVSDGAIVHQTFWNMDAEPGLQGTFGISGTVDFFDPREIHNNAGHPSWGGIPGPILPDGSIFWADNGDELSTTTGEVIATHDSPAGPGASVFNGTTIHNGFDYDSFFEVDITDLITEQLGFLAGGIPNTIALSTDSTFGASTDAANNLGLSFDTFDFSTIGAALGTGQYSFAIIDNPASTFSAADELAIDTFIEDGNRAHFSYWNLDASPALQATFDVDSTVEFTLPRDVFDNAGHPSWAGATSPVTTTGVDEWADNGDELTSTAGEVVSTFDSAAGAGATVAGNDNRTLANGFEYDSLGLAGVTDLLESQIDWVRTAAPPPPPPGSAVVLFDSSSATSGRFIVQNAAAAAGVTVDLEILDDFIALDAAAADPSNGVFIINNSCCFFGGGYAASIADRVAAGARVHQTFWNMDAEPGLQATFGISGAVDFFDPREVHNNISHPSWGSVAGPILPDGSIFWADNGDELTPAAGGTVVSTHDSTAGPGATVVANGDTETTLHNGFDYDSFFETDMTDLITAQLEWLLDGDTVCLPDIDMDGELTIFDFLAFQNLFDMGDLAADFDGDGFLTIFDFLEFQNLFDMGCP